MEQFKDQLKAFVQKEITREELEVDLVRCLEANQANADAIQQVLANLGSQGILEMSDAQHLTQKVLQWQAPAAVVDADVDHTIGFQELLKQYLNRLISLETVKAGLQYDLGEDSQNIVRYEQVLSALAKKGSTLPIEDIDELLDVIYAANESQSDNDGDEEEDEERTVFKKREKAVPEEDDASEKTVFKKRTRDSSRRRDRTSRTGRTSTGTSTGTDTRWAKPFDRDDEVQIGVGSLLRSGRYRLTEFIGYGGMGDVYKAEDTLSVEAGDLEHKDYAVKVLNKEFRDHPESLKTLQRETRKTANLSHEHVVNVFSIDRDEHSVFMVMELMRGEDLRDILKKNPEGLPREKALRYILEMSDALRYAHTQDIIHSDFKPGNVFIDNDSVKVIDFGIARAADDGKEKTDTFDAGDLGALTPSYASLEMLSDGSNPDPKDDIYALGCLSYELLTGRHPFMDGRKKIPADKAKELGLKPAVIPGLKSWQWKAIKDCLEFDRADRLGDLVGFIHDMKMEKKPLSTKLVAGSAAAVIGLAAGSYLLLEQLDQNELNGFVELMENDEHQRVLERIAELQSKYQSDKDRLDEFFVDNESTLNYLLGRIEGLVTSDDFEIAMPVLQVAKIQYPKDVDVRDLELTFNETRAKRVNELDTQIKDLLKAPEFGARYSELRELWAVSKRIDELTPQDATAVLAILKLQDTARALEESQELAEANDLVTFSIELFQSDQQLEEQDYASLISLQQALQRGLGRLQIEQQVTELEGKLISIGSNSSMQELVAAVDDISELSKLEPENSVVEIYRTRLDDLLNQEVTDFVARRDWSDALVTIDKFESILGATEITRLRSQVNTARSEFDSRSTDLNRQIGIAARSSKPGDAIPLLDQLKFLGAPDATIESAQNQVAQGWLQQARIQTNQDNYQAARNFIDQALAIAKDPNTVSQLREQLNIIEELKVSSESQLASERIEERRLQRVNQIASLEQQVNVEVNSVALDASSVGSLINLLDQLEVLDVNNSALETARVRLSERYLEESRDLVGADNLDRAVTLIQDSMRLLPSQENLVQRLDELQGLVRQELAAEEAQKSSDMETELRSLVDQFDAARDTPRLISMLNDYELQVSGQNVISRDIRFQAADSWIDEAQSLARSNRFNEAESAIASARRFDPSHGRIAGLVKLVADSRIAYEESQVELRRDAEIAGLKQSFINQIRALDTNAANRTLADLRTRDLPETDVFWRTTVPDESERAYVALADRSSANDVEQAIELVEAGLSSKPESVPLQARLTKYKLRQQIVQLMTVNQQQASQLLAQAKAKYGNDDELFASLTIAAPQTPVASTAITSSAVGKDCEFEFAGRGLRTRNTCYDMVGGDVKGPRLVVVDSSSGPYAIMRYELRVAEYNDYCTMTSTCSPLGAERNLPVTGLSATQIRGYVDWLSQTTGEEYRIPTLEEWRHAATAEGVDQADRNCVAVGGRGLNMQPINFMKEKGFNGWGLAHTVGNAQELVLDGSEYKAAGGAFSNNNIDCKPTMITSSDGSADALTGFRLIRKM